MKQKINLIWQRRGLVEKDWVEYLFDGFDVEDIHDYERSYTKEDSVIVDDLVDIDSAYLKEIERTRNCILFHVSDESYRFDYKIYSSFAAVIRNYWSPAFKSPRVLVVPLGCRGIQSNIMQVKQASKRPYSWSFVGTMHASRPEMMKNLKPITPNLTQLLTPGASTTVRMNHDQYRKLLSDSIFSPCPMGNSNIECFRLYESLNAGCIPVVEKRLLLNYYKHLLGDNPLICVKNWREAATTLSGMICDKAFMDEKQAEVMSWWRKIKAEQQSKVGSFVVGAFASGYGARNDDALRVSYAGLGRRWRYFELIRHHSAPALYRRARTQLDRILGGYGA